MLGSGLSGRQPFAQNQRNPDLRHLEGRRVDVWYPVPLSPRDSFLTSCDKCEVMRQAGEVACLKE